MSTYGTSADLHHHSHIEHHHPPATSTASYRAVVPLRMFNILFLLGVYVVNILANHLPLFGNTIGGVSDKHPTVFTPAGYAFAIWGLIYFFLALFGLYQLSPKTYDSAPVNNGISFLFILTCVFNIGFVLSWNAEILWLSFLSILLLLVTLFVIHFRLTSLYYPPRSWGEYICVFIPFSLYPGWVFAATFACGFVVFTDHDHFTRHRYIIAATVCAAFIGLVGVIMALGIFLKRRKDLIFAAVVVWALIAIGVKQRHNSHLVEWTAFGASFAVAGAILLGMVIAMFEWLTGKRKRWVRLDEEAV